SETWTYTASHAVTQAEIDAGTALVNTASVDTDQTTPLTDDATTTVAQTPALTPLKAGVLDMAVVLPTDRADVGDVVHYTISATNTGNVTLTGVTVVDAKLGTLVCTPLQPATLLPGESISCT